MTDTHYVRTRLNALFGKLNPAKSSVTCRIEILFKISRYTVCSVVIHFHNYYAIEAGFRGHQEM